MIGILLRSIDGQDFAKIIMAPESMLGRIESNLHEVFNEVREANPDDEWDWENHLKPALARKGFFVLSGLMQFDRPWDE